MTRSAARRSSGRVAAARATSIAGPEPTLATRYSFRSRSRQWRDQGRGRVLRAGAHGLGGGLAEEIRVEQAPQRVAATRLLADPREHHVIARVAVRLEAGLMLERPHLEHRARHAPQFRGREAVRLAPALGAGQPDHGLRHGRVDQGLGEPPIRPTGREPLGLVEPAGEVVPGGTDFVEQVLID